MAVAVSLVWLGWHVSAVLVTLHVLVCFVLIVVIMLQSGNAADLAGAFGGAGSQTAFGPRGAATFLSRATTWCAIVFMMTSLTLSFKRAPNQSTTGSILEQTSQPGSAPSKPAAAPPIQIPVQPPQSAPQAPAPSQQTPAPAQQTPAPAQQTPAPAPNPAPKN
jgi:preprotein translocase subunit SecG